jgi:hypothetical protein
MPADFTADQQASLTRLHAIDALCSLCRFLLLLFRSPAYSTGACGGDITLQATNVASVRLCTALGHVTIGATLDSVLPSLLFLYSFVGSLVFERRLRWALQPWSGCCSAERLAVECGR